MVRRLLNGCAGNGGYGRLGHTQQKDEFSPKQVETLKGRMPVDPKSPVTIPFLSLGSASDAT